MNRKRKLLTICAIATTFTLSSVPAFAKVIGYVTEKDGVRYEYSKDDLVESIINGNGAYERYLSEKLVALKDDVRGYIDADDVVSAIINGSVTGETVDVDSYTESETAKASEITESDVIPIDKDGNVVEKEEKVTTIKVKTPGVLPGMDLIEVTLGGVDNPQDYEVKFGEKAFKYADGVFIGVAKTGTTVEQLTITQKQ